MKKHTRRRSSRNSTQNVENTSPYMGRSSRSLANENASQRRNTKTTLVAEESSQRKRKRSISTSVERSKVPKRMGDGRVIDAYCWVCHKLGGESICRSCPRVYHKDCLKKVKGNSNESQVCDCRMKRVDGKNEDLDLQNLKLQNLLQFVMQEAIKEKKNNQKPQKDDNKFCTLFQSWAVENEMLCKIMDLNILIDQMNGETAYRSSGQFFLDVKWIYHNCCILYGSDSKITETALKLQKNFKIELTDMEACPECYSFKYADKYVHADFFTHVCTNDHEIVWAQIRGSPYWPAKLMSVQNDHADVRFFGTHDKANILIKKCFKISVEPPLKKTATQRKLNAAISELTIYVSNYEAKKKKKFPYYPADTPLENNSAFAKKHLQKNKQRTEDERVSRQDNSSSNPGTQEEPDLEKRSTVAEVKCLRNFADNGSNQKRTDCVGDFISSDVFCEMNFSTKEHNGHAGELNNTDECMNTSNYSVPQPSISKKFSLDLLNENSNLLPAASDLSSSRFVTSTEIDQVNFDNFSALSCVVSSNENPSNSVSADLNTSSNLPVITSTKSVCTEYNSKHITVPHENPFLMNDSHIDNLSSEFARPSSVSSYDNNVFESNDDHEENDSDVEIISENVKETTAQILLRNKSVLNSVVELLFGNKPQIKEQLKSLNTFILQNFLFMWVEFCSSKFDRQDLQGFHNVCEKYQDLVKKHETTNSELVKEINMLQGHNKKLEEELSCKDALLDSIQQSAAKMQKNNKETDGVCSEKILMDLEAKVEQLSMQLNKAEQEINFKEMQLNKAKEEINDKEMQMSKLREECEGLKKQHEENVKRSEAVICRSSQTEETDHELFEREIDTTSTFIREAYCSFTTVSDNRAVPQILQPLDSYVPDHGVIQHHLGLMNSYVPDHGAIPHRQLGLMDSYVPDHGAIPHRQLGLMLNNLPGPRVPKNQCPNYLTRKLSTEFLNTYNSSKSKGASNKTSGRKKKNNT